MGSSESDERPCGLPSSLACVSTIALRPFPLCPCSCDEAADEWTAAARSASSSSAVGGTATTAWLLGEQSQAGGAAATGSGERPATNDAQRPISGKRGPGIGAGGAASGVRSPGGATATTRRAVGLAALLERTAEAAGEQPDSASSSAAPAPQDAWQLLQRAQAAGAGAAAAGALAVGPDGRRRSADGSPMDGHGALSPTSPGGTAASSMMMMASPPLLATRSLAEMAGLTGSMRGSGLKRLLSEGSLQPAASMTSGSGSGDGGANASGDAAAAEGGAPSPTTPTDSQRSASIDASFATGIAAVDAVTAGGHGTVPAHPHAAAASTASSTPSKGPGGARLSVAIQPLHTGSASSRGSTDVASPLPLMTPGSLAGRRVSTAAQQALLLQQQMQVAPPMSPVARSLGLEAQLRADARRAAAAPPVPGASLLAVMALLERRVTQVLQEFQSCVSGAISAAGADGHGADTAGAGVISEGEGSHALSRLAGVPAVRLSLAAAAVLAAANGGNGHTGAAEAAVQPSPNRSPRAAADTTATGDALFAATGGALQFMGPRGPRIERAADLHAFHIEPPSPDDVVLAGDVHAAAAALLAAGSAAAAAAAAAGAADAREELAALEGMQEKYALLRRNRRASLASIVDGVATAPPGPASAILALSAGSMPKVEARPGTVYAAAAAPDSADRLSRGQLHGRPLTTGTTTPGVPSRRESANDLSLAAAAAAMAAAGGEGEGVSPPGAGRASRHSIRSAGGSASGSASASGSPYGSVILPPPQESPMATMSTSGGGGGTSPSRGGARLHSRSGSPSGRAGTAGGVASGSSSPRLFPSPSSAGAGAAGIGLGGGLTSPAMSYILSNRSQDPSVGAAGAGAAAGNLASLLTRSRRGSAADSVVSQSGGFGALLGGRSGPGGAAGSGAAAAGMGLGPLQLNPAGSRALYLVERHAGAAAQALASGRPNSPLKPYVVGAGGPPSPLARAMPMPATFGDASASPSAATRSPGGGGMIEELEGAMRHEPVTVGILPAAFALGPGADGSASPGGSGAGTAGASPSTTIGGAGAVRVADRDGYEAWIRSRMATAAAAATAAGLDTAPGSAKKRKARGSSDAKAGKGSGSVLAALAPRAAAGAGASPGASPSGSNSSSRLPSLTPSNSARKAAPSPAAAGGLASSASAPALGTGYPSRIGLTSSEISDGGMSMTMTMGELPELLEGDHDGNDGGEAAAMRRGHGAGMSAGLHGIIPLTAAADALAPGAQAGGLASEMAAASSARRAKYPKSLPSGFKVASITSYAGAGSQHAYAQYSGNATAAARQRLQLAAAGFQPSGAAASAGTTAPQTSGRGPAAIAVPLDAATLRRDVRQRYAALGIGTGAQASAVGAAGEPSLLFGGPGVGDGQGIYGSTGSLPLAYGAAGAAAGGTSERRGSTAGGASGATVAMAVQLIKPGVFDESRHAEAQRLREQEREKSRRRASLASLENSLAKSRAKANQQIEAAERERDALRAVIAGDAPQAGYATSTYAAGGAGGIGGSAFGLADASEGMTLLTGGRRGEGYGYGEAAASSASLPIPPILRALQELQDRQRQKLAQLGGVAAPAPAVVAPAAAAAAKAPQAVKPAANLEAAAAEGKATDGDVGRAMPAPLAAAEHKEDDAGSDEKPISAADATAASAAAAVAAEAVAAAAAATAGDAGGRHDDDGVKPATAADLATASLPFSPGLPPGYIRLASGAVLALPGAEPGLVPGAVAAPAQTVALTAMQPVSGPEAAASGSPSGGAQIQAQTDRGSTSRSSSRASSSTASVRPPPGFALARAPSGQMVMVPAAALRAAQQSRAGSPGGSTGATSPQAASGSASGRATPQPPSDSSADAPPERG